MSTEESTNAGISRRFRFSIIIPALNEAERINSVIEHLRAQAGSEACEIIVVDGDTNRSTITAINDKDVIAVSSEKGRGRQMNAGAALARGQILIFLHADTELPPAALKKIAAVLENQDYVAGAFDLGIDTDKPLLKYIAARARLRSRLNRVPYGDQAIFMKKSYFEKIGRFKEIPFMEDIDLMRRIKTRGDKIFILPDRVKTSARRWEKEGPLYTTIRNQIIVCLYYLGFRPERLAKYYKNHCDDTMFSKRT